MSRRPLITRLSVLLAAVLVTSGLGSGVASAVTGGAPADGTYTLSTGGRAIDVPGRSTSGGAQLILWSLHEGANQQFAIAKQPDGSYDIRNVNSGLCLDVSGGSMSAGAAIIQWPCTGGSNQRWVLAQVGSRYAVKSVKSGLLISAAAAANGALLTQQADTGGALELWDLAVVGGGTDGGSAGSSLREDFAGGLGAQAPSGWNVENVNTAGMASGWSGWAFHTVAEVVARWGDGGDRGGFSRASGTVAVVHSDQNRPASGTFGSTLWAPTMTLAAHSGSIGIAFSSHYRQGQAPQQARLVMSVDGAPYTVVQTFTADRLDERVSLSVSVPSSTNTVRFGWDYLNSSNNWYWMIDDVAIDEGGSAAGAVPVLTNARKLVGSPGESVTLSLGGLRAGQVADVDFAGATFRSLVASASGTATATVAIPSGQAAGVVPVVVSGSGITTTTLAWGVTVIPAASPGYATNERVIWFDGFENANAGGWTLGGWTLGSLESMYTTSSPDRRHAFTRAAGTIAGVDAARAAVNATLASTAIPVTAGQRIEVRVDSHYRARGSQSAQVVATFSNGTSTTLAALGASDQESIQLRLPVTVPSGATSMSLRFAFQGSKGSGSWFVDSVLVVTPLAALAAGAQPIANVDVISDIQGATSQLRDRVLPGFRRLATHASTIVAVGDLVDGASQGLYDEYNAAFAAGGGRSNYSNVVNVMGNHEYYGSGSVASYRRMWQDNMQMSNVGGQGGFWGEILVDGRLPLLWISSESYVYSQHTGDGPFVELSDAQFTFIQSRIAYWAAQNKPVLLMSHHPLPNTNTGTYISFYQDDFGADTDRVERLLAAYPNVLTFDAHTHWTVKANDWSVQERFIPDAVHAGTITNTGAVTSTWGPSGDWAETVVGSDPTGLRVALYDDRVRITAYTFSANGTPTEVNRIDVALPAA